VVNLLNFVPLEAGWVFNRTLEFWLGFAICNNIKKIAITAVFGYSLLVRRKQYTSSSTAYAFDLDEPEFA
jgi:hypothetical protein